MHTSVLQIPVYWRIPCTILAQKLFDNTGSTFIYCVSLWYAKFRLTYSIKFVKAIIIARIIIAQACLASFLRVRNTAKVRNESDCIQKTLLGPSRVHLHLWLCTLPRAWVHVCVRALRLQVRGIRRIASRRLTFRGEEMRSVSKIFRSLSAASSVSRASCVSRTSCVSLSSDAIRLNVFPFL